MNPSSFIEKRASPAELITMSGNVKGEKVGKMRIRHLLDITRK